MMSQSFGDSYVVGMYVDDIREEHMAELCHVSLQKVN